MITAASESLSRKLHALKRGAFQEFIEAVQDYCTVKMITYHFGWCRVGNTLLLLASKLGFDIVGEQIHLPDGNRTLPAVYLEQRSGPNSLREALRGKLKL